MAINFTRSTNPMRRPAERGVLPGEPGRLAVPKLHCRWCGKPVPPGRRSWCGEACVEEMRIRNWPGHARAKVLERDRGICAACGRDCVALAAKIARWLERFEPYGNRWSLARRWLRRVAKISTGDTLWQADHIVPVVEGGGGCGLDNLRTLCICCHKAETRALARRRADGRRQARDLATLPLFGAANGGD